MKKRRYKTAAVLLSLILTVSLCMGMVLYRAGMCLPLYDEAALLAGRLSFADGSFEGGEEAFESAPQRPLAPTPTQPTESAEKPKQTTHSGSSHPITETKVSNGNMKYGNFAIRNTTDYSLDPAAILQSPLPFTVDDSRTVQVLVYHTHTCESYMTEDSGVYYDDFYPRSTDGSQGVAAVGEALAEGLKAHGIGTVHDTTLHDYPSYEGSYARSWDTITAYGEKYPSIKITIDLHRDSMTAEDGTKYKPTFEYDGKKAAQLMIMTGYDTGGDFDFWDENLVFAMKLQQQCEALYPGMTRPLNFGEFTYNMNFNNGSLLIEVGTDANTVEECCRTGEYLANALSTLLQSE